MMNNTGLPDKGLVENLFNIHGSRLNRKRFLKRYFAILGLYMVGLLVLAIGSGEAHSSDWAALPLNLIGTAAMYTIFVRREHDLGKETNGPFWLAAFGCFLMQCGDFKYSLDGLGENFVACEKFYLTGDAAVVLVLLFLGIFTLLSLYYMVRYFFFSGTQGENVYGPDSLPRGELCSATSTADCAKFSR